MKLLVGFFLFFSLYAHASEPLLIATGEYAPYSGEKIPNQGISTLVIKAVFKELNQEITINFMPWKRAMSQLQSGVVAGSYPWTISEERLDQNYYSLPIHKYRILAYTKIGNHYDSKESLTGKRVCLPIGWNSGPFEKWVKKIKLVIVSPVNAESCFSMLDLGRVDVTYMGEQVGTILNNKILGSRSRVIGSEQNFFTEANTLHFIVSKKYPNAKKLIEDFNHGFLKIKANGIYQKIVESKSTCGFCNQLGSL